MTYPIFNPALATMSACSVDITYAGAASTKRFSSSLVVAPYVLRTIALDSARGISHSTTHVASFAAKSRGWFKFMLKRV